MFLLIAALLLVIAWKLNEDNWHRVAIVCEVVAAIIIVRLVFSLILL